MARYRLSAAAEQDIVDILAWSEARFGRAVQRRYARLITMALRDVGADPMRPGSQARPELGEGVRSWHLRHSRERARDASGAIHRPRHFLIYRLRDPSLVVIGRVLHDAMELTRHMSGLEPSEF